MTENALIVFTKNPVKGKIKTRLAKDIGDEDALKVYMQLLKHTREITEELDICENYIFYNEFIPTRDNWSPMDYQKMLQKGDGLGEKMKNAFNEMFKEGYSKVVIISPDCPDLKSANIQQAFKLLEKNDYVIGPLTDGGYYLLGMKAMNEKIFEDKQWSTESVYPETVKNIEEEGASYFALPTLSDVDYAEDLTKKLKRFLEESNAPKKKSRARKQQ